MWGRESNLLIFSWENSDSQDVFMPKYKEIDYKAPRSRWPLWVIPFLVAILLLLIGIFIFITIAAKHHRCLFFDCEQPRDKIVKPSELRDGVVIPPKDDDEKSSSQGSQNKTNEADHKENLMSLYGELIFDGGAPQSLPPNSHLKVKFEDVSIMDAASLLVEETWVDLSNYNSAQNLKYFIKCEKPTGHGRYSVSAVLNMGWQADGNSWIRKGDFFTDTSHNVKIEEEVNEYKMDVTLVRYNYWEVSLSLKSYKICTVSYFPVYIISLNSALFLLTVVIVSAFNFFAAS